MTDQEAELIALRAQVAAHDQHDAAWSTRVAALEADGIAARRAASDNFARAERAEAALTEGEVLLARLDDHLSEAGYMKRGPMRSIVARLRALAGEAP